MLLIYNLDEAFHNSLILFASSHTSICVSDVTTNHMYENVLLILYPMLCLPDNKVITSATTTAAAAAATTNTNTATAATT